MLKVLVRAMRRARGASPGARREALEARAHGRVARQRGRPARLVRVERRGAQHGRESAPQAAQKVGRTVRQSRRGPLVQ